MQLGYHAKFFSAIMRAGGEHINFCIPLKTGTHNPMNYAPRCGVHKIFCLQLWPEAMRSAKHRASPIAGASLQECVGEQTNDTR